MRPALNGALARASLIWKGDGSAARNGNAVISSGVPALDEALSLGGLPLGAVTEIRCKVGLGAVSLAMRTCAQALAATQDALCVVVDGPGTLHAPAVLEAGIPPGRLWCVRPGDPARASLIGLRMVRSGAFRVVVVDQAFDAPPQADLSVRRLSVAAQQAACAVILLSGPWADKEALPLPCAVRLRLSRPSRTELEVRVDKQRGAIEGGVVRFGLARRASGGR